MTIPMQPATSSMTPNAPPSAAPGADPLDALTIPIPCTVPWESMTGDARVRFCGQCKLQVHDLSAMTRDDAVAFLFAKKPGERTCVRFHRRPDGRVVTADCLKAVRAIRRRALLVTAAVLGALGLGGAAWARAAASDAGGGLSNPDAWDRQPFATIARIVPASWLPARAVAGAIPMAGRVVMGDFEAPSPTQGTPPTHGTTVPETRR